MRRHRRMEPLQSTLNRERLRFMPHYTGEVQGSTLRNELQLVLMAVKELPAGDLPRLLGEIEEIRVTAMARLTVPGPSQPQQYDELLDATGAAHRLGISKDYL